ncbi:Protein ssh4 [Umbelopsis sp. WA50703]
MSLPATLGLLTTFIPLVLADGAIHIQAFSSVWPWIFLVGIIVLFSVCITLLCCTRRPIALPLDDEFTAEFDEWPLEREEDLATLSEDAVLSYTRAKAWQQQHPPDCVPTDITLSQYMSIQEKGIQAYEFEFQLESNSFVAGRTEIQFYHGESCVQTNLPLPRNQEVYYWEAKMYEMPDTTVVSVGVATKPYPNWRLPGWNRYSIGYFSDSGRKFTHSIFNSRPCSLPFNEGDVIGVGYRHRTGSVFFTRNGRKVDDISSNLNWNLFPTIGANGPCQVHVNLGQLGFVYVEANVKKWGLAPIQGTMAPPPAYGLEGGSILLASSSRGGDTGASTSGNTNPNHASPGSHQMFSASSSRGVQPPPYSSFDFEDE